MPGFLIARLKYTTYLVFSMQYFFSNFAVFQRSITQVKSSSLINFYRSIEEQFDFYKECSCSLWIGNTQQRRSHGFISWNIHGPTIGNLFLFLVRNYSHQRHIYVGLYVNDTRMASGYGSSFVATFIVQSALYLNAEDKISGLGATLNWDKSVW